MICSHIRRFLSILVHTNFLLSEARPATPTRVPGSWYCVDIVSSIDVFLRCDFHLTIRRTVAFLPDITVPILHITNFAVSPTPSVIAPDILLRSASRYIDIPLYQRTLLIFLCPRGLCRRSLRAF